MTQFGFVTSGTRRLSRIPRSRLELSITVLLRCLKIGQPHSRSRSVGEAALSDRHATEPGPAPRRVSRGRELTNFMILAFGIWPVVAVGAVGGYGFLVWMYQLVAGPPGPAGH
ncbi:periplasmic nitrate reductase, NapE protein [Roseovarius indicus]|uniref:periplasmic nitrate reductase, NapE protein n=1 Tax=Roseovarius indicus TaxID=540747 RepID=UPI0010FD3F67|nr:periplasmic nitrate reductase, NapE protein [Roseovarius indicus]